MPAWAADLTSGEFQVNLEWRSRFDTGDGIRMALEACAASNGKRPGGHSVTWDDTELRFSDLAASACIQQFSYSWGVMANAADRRFVD